MGEGIADRAVETFQEVHEASLLTFQALGVEPVNQ